MNWCKVCRWFLSVILGTGGAETPQSKLSTRYRISQPDAGKWGCPRHVSAPCCVRVSTDSVVPPGLLQTHPLVLPGQPQHQCRAAPGAQRSRAAMGGFRVVSWSVQQLDFCTGPAALPKALGLFCLEDSPSPLCHVMGKLVLWRIVLERGLCDKNI